MQNEEPQRPATARPSLLSAGPGQGEALNILSELDGKTGHAPRAGKGARPGRKELVTWSVLVLAAMGCTAAMVLRDVGTMAQVAQVGEVAQGLERSAADADQSQRAGDGVAGGETPAMPAGINATATAAGTDAGAGPGLGPVKAAAVAAGAEPAAGPANAAMVAAPAVGLAAALAAPAVDKPSTAATIIDTPPAAAEPAPVRKAVAKTRKAVPVKERRTRIAKARAPEQKVAKAKVHKKPAAAPQKPQATPDSDVELLAALVAHTKPQQGSRAAPCPPADDKSAGAACGAGRKQ